MAANQTSNQANTQENQSILKDRRLLVNARQKGKFTMFGAFVRLSGPGWMQSAITLGGGSMAGSLYLGVLGGFTLLWVQPLAMILGVIMLSAIGYVTLSTGERPFQAINKHVNPVLGWGWAIATLMANLVWSLPQFSLGDVAVRQNLLPHIFGPEVMSEFQGKLIVCLSLFFICGSVVFLSEKGGWGLKLFEWFLKIMVAVIVICFFGVVVKMSFVGGGLDWSAILKGLVPNFKNLTAPSEALQNIINTVDVQFQSFWTEMIVSQQRAVMIGAAASAVGINMTFLLPYSMLKRGWNKDFRGLAIFDLSTGLFIPFILATGCVVIASASQFHAQPAAGLLETDADGQTVVQVDKKILKGYQGLAKDRIKYEIGAEAFDALSDEEKSNRIDSLPYPDKQLSAMLVKRDAFSLARAISPLTGDRVSQYLFGIGVVGMAISSIIILMLVNGFVVCEMFGIKAKGWPFRLACLAPGVGLLGPFFWTKAAFWLAVPTAVFGMILLPVAYFSFIFLMNQKSLLGKNRPTGSKRFLWNSLMAVAAGAAFLASLWSIWTKLKWIGIGLMIAFILLASVVHVVRPRKN